MTTQTEPDLAAAPPPATSKTFARRDYFLLPLLSFATMLAMFGAAELAARALWPAQADTRCDQFDQFGNLSAKSNCTVRTKIAEGPWVTYRFNECGYRTDSTCHAKPAGTLRIVLLGSSVAEGLDVLYEQTFAERTGRAIERATGRSVQVENLGFQNLSPLHCYRKLNEALALNPDLVIYAVSPFDLDQQMDAVQLAHRNDAVPMLSRPATHYKVSWLKRLQKQLDDSRAVLVAQHFLFSNTETYLRLYMAYGDRADYLRTPLSARWQSRFSDFNLILTDMASRLRRADVPFVLLAVPSRPQAALLSVKRQPPHTDPFAFGRLIGQMTAANRVPYVNALDDFRREPNCDHLFYSVDSHVTGEGNAVLAHALIRRCLALITASSSIRNDAAGQRRSAARLRNPIAPGWQT